MKTSSRNLAMFCAALYLVPCAILFVMTKRHNGGHFIYSLDDPYIHLALAENLARGHYGINLSELSTPSSSIVWPFLLLPFTGRAIHAYLPLLWNLLFGTMAACLIGWAVNRWPPQGDNDGYMPLWQKTITAALLMLCANLPGLTFVGMEHVLQILLSIVCAVGIMEGLSGRAIPVWSLAAAVVAPMVRYEDIALTAAMCIALAGTREWRKWWAVLSLSLAPLLAFSIFLAVHKLPILPMSVLVKGNVYASGGPLYRMFKQIRSNIFNCFFEQERFPIVILFLLFLGLAWDAKTRSRRFLFAGAAATGGLQLAIGRFGWFYRYEVYALVFMLVISMKVLAERRRFLFGYFALGLLCCASPFIRAMETSVASSEEVYRQQYQMHRFVTDYYHGDYAVNDLGLPSYRRNAGAYVLDVYGLASVEASRQTSKSATWLDAIVKRHGTNLAMLYSEWFEIPPSWTPVAKMCIPHDPINVGERCVLFYSTNPEAVATIRASLVRFAPTLPRDVIFYFDPERREGGYPMMKEQQRLK